MPTLNGPGKEHFKNIVGKGENSSFQYFLSSHIVLSCHQRKLCTVWAALKLLLSIGSKILSCVNSFHWTVYLSPSYFHRTTWIIFEIFNLIYVLSVLSIVWSMLVNLYYNAINKQWKEGEFKSVTQWRIPEDVDTCFSFKKCCKWTTLRLNFFSQEWDLLAESSMISVSAEVICCQTTPFRLYL